MSQHLQPAIVGAVTAILTLLIRDVGIKLWHARKEERRSTRAVFRRYSDPLASSASSLLWRLEEILNGEGRGAYLLIDTHATKFAEYKRLSTVYRLLSLLGWIRAFRRELSFLRPESDEHVSTIKKAINSLEAALADGAHVEAKRLRGLLTLWDIDANLDEQTQMRLGISIDQVLKSELHSNKCLVARDLPKDKQRELSSKLARTVATELGVNEPPAEVLDETVARAAQCLSHREAWIYRDWQAGLGDLMLKEIDNGPRKYDVIGFAEFESLSLSGSEDDKRWIARANAMLENLDTSGSDKYDQRYEQLKGTFKATAKLLLALTWADRQQEILQGKSIELAETVIGSAEND